MFVVACKVVCYVALVVDVSGWWCLGVCSGILFVDFRIVCVFAGLDMDGLWCGVVAAGVSVVLGDGCV